MREVVVVSCLALALVAERTGAFLLARLLGVTTSVSGDGLRLGVLAAAGADALHQDIKFCMTQPHKRVEATLSGLRLAK